MQKGLLLIFLDLSCNFHSHPSILTLSTAAASLLLTYKLSTLGLTFPASGQLVSLHSVFLPSLHSVFLPLCGTRGARPYEGSTWVSPRLPPRCTITEPSKSSSEGQGHQNFLASSQLFGQREPRPVVEIPGKTASLC